VALYFFGFIASKVFFVTKLSLVAKAPFEANLSFFRRLGNLSFFLYLEFVA
jgi:hypothetical protein